MLIIFCACACNQKSQRQTDPRALELNKQAVELVRYNNPDSARKAIELLDQASSIDSNCVNCFSNKLGFLFRLKEYQKAIQTVNRLLELRPGEYYFHFTGGMLNEITGDTVAARFHFNKALDLSKRVQDTLTNSSELMGLTIVQANIMVMLGDSVNANRVLENLVANLPQNKESEFWKEVIPSYMNKTKKDLLDELINPGGQGW